jgi:O-antigen ligase
VNRSQALLILVTVPVLIGATAASYDALMSSSDDQQLHTVVRRLEWFEGSVETDEAAEGRLYGAQQAWRLFLESPVTGRGIGITTMEVIVGEGPHNMYLMLMAEQGFVGLVLYLSFIAVIGRAGLRLARNAGDQEGHDIGKAMILLAMFMFAYGFFSHNVFEEAQGMFVLAFMIASASAASRGASWTSALRPDFQPAAAATKLNGRLGVHR